MAANLPKTMLAWQKHFPSKEPVRVEVPVPSPIKDEILVKIHAAGVCHSDVALRDMEVMASEWQQAESKFTYGHEGCGEVISNGPEAKIFRRGDIVAVMILPGCAEDDCAECADGLTQLCQRGPRYGGGQDGFFAPYVKVSERAAIKLPPNVSVAAGAVATDACMTAYHAVVGRARVTRGETVLILGLGGLGLNGLQIALHLGARAIISDKRQAVLDEAKRFGVKDEDIVPPDTKDIGEWIRKKKIRVDKAIDFVSMQPTFSAAVDSVRLAGTVVSVGLLSSELIIPTSKMVRRQLSILGSYAGTISDVKECLDLISQGHLVPQVEERSMRDFPTILEDLHQGKFKGRIVLVPENDGPSQEF